MKQAPAAARGLQGLFFCLSHASSADRGHPRAIIPSAERRSWPMCRILIRVTASGHLLKVNRRRVDRLDIWSGLQLALTIAGPLVSYFSRMDQPVPAGIGAACSTVWISLLRQEHDSKLN